MWESLDDAKRNLEDVKKSLRSFLIRTYEDEETALNTFKYLSKAISRIIKKESVKIEFSHGGDVVWYMSIFNYMANWLEAEKKTSDLLTKELEDINEEDATS